ncbi:MAG: YezD family protein [Gammaproteobacteria bacterium]
MNKQGNDLAEPDSYREVVAHLLTLLPAMRFGSIEIVVHDGRVVQIDKHEKYRFKTLNDNQ